MAKFHSFSWVLAAASTALAVVAVVAPGTARAESTSCTNGAVIMGDPKAPVVGNPNPEGADLHKDPPILFRSIVVAGSKVFSHTAEEIWVADLPGEKLKRLAGEQNTKSFVKLIDGPCATARFMRIQSIGLLPDGSLVVADETANSLLEVKDPLGPGCTVSYLAGNVGPIQRAGKPGDVDGPGKTAKVNDPRWPLADEAGVIYFIDGGTFKLKKIATDPDRTVSTLVTLDDPKGYPYVGLTLMGKKLYAVTNSFAKAFIYEIDTETGAKKKILEADAKAFSPPLSLTTAPTLSSVTNDGKNLIVTGQGYIWRVTPAGKVTHIAGAGSPPDFPKGYDPKSAVAAKKLLLRFRNSDIGALGSTTAMAYQDGVLFWRGRSDGPYVLSIACK